MTRQIKLLLTLVSFSFLLGACHGGKGSNKPQPAIPDAGPAVEEPPVDETTPTEPEATPEEPTNE